MQKQETKHKNQRAFAILAVFAVVALTTAGPAAANYTFTGQISDLGQVISDFLTLDDELLHLVIFGVVVTSAAAIGAFIPGFLSMILNNMRVGLR